MKNIGISIYKYRWIIAAAIFIICVILGINGSSIGEWSSFLGGEDTGLLLGVSRAIRGDEWATSTPIALSQYFDASGAFSYFSDVVRGMPTDVFLEYGQPVRDIAVLFRPFHWGYLFLSPSMGLAFYWSGRYILLFMISFEMGMFITNKNKLLALAYASLVLWSPLIQWWFATNGLVEMLIYLQLSILLFSHYFSWASTWKRAVCSVGIALCAGGFILTMYPAWMVPLGYTLLGLIIWVFLTRDRVNIVKKVDVLIAAIVALVFALLMFYILHKSWDTVITIANTSYPGGRFETGGGYGLKLFNYVSNIWYALKGEGAGAINVCESAQFIDFFPVCYILPLLVFFREKRKDSLLIILMIISVCLEIFVVVGYPAWMAKLTLLGVCTPFRVYQITGFVNVILVIRSMALMKKSFSRFVAVGLALFCSVVVVFIARKLEAGYYTSGMLLVMAVLFGSLFFFLFQSGCRYAVRGFVAVCCATMLFSGLMVNPIRRGCDNIYEIPIVQEIVKVHRQDPDGLWIVEGLGYPATNVPIMVGAPTINSINVYPALERWEILDPEGVYFEAYNRYAHIWINLKMEGKAEFYNQAADCLTVHMTLEDMKKIGTKYLFTGNELEDQYGNGVERICECGNFKIYRIK